MFEGVKDFFDGMLHGRDYFADVELAPKRPEDVPEYFEWNQQKKEWLEPEYHKEKRMEDARKQICELFKMICQVLGNGVQYVDEDNWLWVSYLDNTARAYVHEDGKWVLVYDCKPEPEYGEKVYEGGDWEPEICELAVKARGIQDAKLLAGDQQTILQEILKTLQSL